MKEQFKTPEVTSALDIPRERLQAWINAGFIKPAVSGVGHGSRTLFSRDDVMAVATFNALTTAGGSRDLAAKAMQDLDEREWKVPSGDPVEFLVIVRCKETVASEPSTQIHAIGANEDFHLFIHNIPGAGGDWEYLGVVNVSFLSAGVDAALSKLSDG